MTLRPRASLHGADISAPSYAKLPARAVFGSQCMTEDLLGRQVFDAAEEVWLPLEYIPFEYDFDTDGGTVGTHALSEKIPANVIVVDGLYDVIDPLAGAAGARIRIEAEATGDILATTLITSAGTAGLHAIVPTLTGGVSTCFKTTGERTINLVIVGGSGLTGGKLVGYLRVLRGFPLAETSSASSNSSSSSSSNSSSSSSSSSKSSASSNSSSSSSNSLSSNSSSSSSHSSSVSSQSSESSSSVEESHSSLSSNSSSSSSNSSSNSSSSSSKSSNSSSNSSSSSSSSSSVHSSSSSASSGSSSSSSSSPS